MANGHGGARKGAGRRKGSTTKRKLELAIAVRETGLTPLDCMLILMRSAYETAIRNPEKIDAGAAKLAVAWAHDAAPYCHPKLISHEVGGRGSGSGQLIPRRGTVICYLPDNGRRNVPAAANEEKAA